MFPVYEVRRMRNAALGLPSGGEGEGGADRVRVAQDWKNRKSGDSACFDWAGVCLSKQDYGP